MKRNTVFLFILGVLLAALTGWTIWGNTALMVSRYTIESGELPERFEGFTIAQVSDLHNAAFGAGNEKLLQLLEEQAPDVIFITGDLVDSRRTDIKVAAEFAAACADIAPTYYATGNHESRIDSYATLEDALIKSGVTVLRDEAISLDRDGQWIQIIGLDDPDFTVGRDWLFDDSDAAVNQVLSELVEENAFTVMLSHRPELFDVYVKNGVNVTLSGHAHGGQFRLPLVGGLIAPDQGLFPVYDAGVFSEGNCCMVVSRGLGNSILPIRFNNRPELVMVTLQS